MTSIMIGTRPTEARPPSCDALLNPIKELQSQGITFAFARARDEVRLRMRLAGIEAIVGSINFHERVTDGVHAWQQTNEQQAAIEEPARTAAL